MSAETIYFLIGVWFFAFGSAIGSFLNVVVYRLPRGMSLSRPGSHCPTCNRPIRWHDNVPIAGWVMLSGRCRDCRSPISPRYPTVEAVTATLFLTVGLVEFLYGGANLPLQTAEPDDVPALSQLGAICAYHLLLLSTLLAAALIEIDGNRPPLRLFVPAMAVGLAAPLLWPHLRPVAAYAATAGWPVGPIGGVAGLAAGASFGWLASRLYAPPQRAGVVLAAACVGLFLGWQAAVWLTLAAIGVLLLLAAFRPLLPSAGRVSPTAVLAVSTLGWILAWARLVAVWPGLG